MDLGRIGIGIQCEGRSAYVSGDDRFAMQSVLSPRSSSMLIRIMEGTSTFPDRLKAGTPRGWILGHKTGTSPDWKGLTVATNDVGFLIAPDGTVIELAVFVADSRMSSAARAAVIASVATAVAGNYHSSTQERTVQ